MRRAVILSTTFHAGLILAMAIGLPLRPEPLEIAPAVPVEVVTIDEVTTAKPSKEAPPEKPQPRPEPTQAAKAPPPPPPQKSEPPAPQPLPAPPPPTPKKDPEPIPEPEPVKQPEPQPEPQPQVAEAPPEPEPEPIPEPEPEPKEEKAEPKPAAPPLPQEKPKAPQLAKAPPKPEPERKQETQLDSILNNVLRDLKPAAKQQQDDAKREKQPEPQPTENVQLSSKPMTISEIDAIRRKIEGCWNVPAGARNAGDLIVEIKLFMNPDGSVRQAEVVDRARMNGDSFYRAAAESALRAVFRCQPLPVPPKKYDTWRQITMRFDPSKML